MDACTVDQLESYSDQLAVAVKGLRAGLPTLDAAEANSDVDTGIAKAKASILASVEGIRTLLDEPNEFLQRLTIQVEILACLKWLAEFQILACIPREVSLPIRDLADLAAVPESQLGRIVRFTASAGFLQETKPGYVSHTAMSAQFMASQSLSDATVFITATATPSALYMADATRLAITDRDAKNPTAYDLALRPPKPFRTACQERSKLGRQWQAYLTHAARSHSEDELVDSFSRLNWSSLGSACIVEVGAQSTSMARGLALAFPNLYFFVQIDSTDTLMRDGDKDVHHRPDADPESNGPDNARIKITFREKGMPQPITGAAVYILHLSSAAELARAELFRHLRPLRVSGGILLVLTARLLPEPGSLSNPRVETVARARDLSMLQMADEGEMEMTELRQIVESVTDEFGKLVVVNELRSYNGLILALALKHLQHDVNIPAPYC